MIGTDTMKLNDFNGLILPLTRSLILEEKYLYDLKNIIRPLKEDSDSAKKKMSVLVKLPGIVAEALPSLSKKELDEKLSFLAEAKDKISKQISSLQEQLKPSLEDFDKVQSSVEYMKNKLFGLGNSIFYGRIGFLQPEDIRADFYKEYLYLLCLSKTEEGKCFSKTGLFSPEAMEHFHQILCEVDEQDDFLSLLSDLNYDQLLSEFYRRYWNP